MSSEPRDLYNPTLQLWEVVGGLGSGGLVVRREAKTTSTSLPYRLTHGSWVQEIDKKGERLHYQRLTGEGPDVGWVSVEVKARGELKVFLEPRDGPPPGWRPAPKKAPAAPPRPPAPALQPAAPALQPAAPVPSNWTGSMALWENMPPGMSQTASAAFARQAGTGQAALGAPPPSKGFGGYGWAGSPLEPGGQPSRNLASAEKAAGQPKAKSRPQAPTSFTSIAGAIRETDYEVDFEVVIEKIMIRRSPSIKDAPLGVVKEGGLLRGVPYDVDGDPWLLLASGTCEELNLHGRQGWVLINGKSVGLGELLRERGLDTLDGKALGSSDAGSAQQLLVREARSRRLGGGRADPEPGEASLGAAVDDGEGAGEAAKPEVISVAFWGICDIKYDPRRPKLHRVKVLELGDGKISRFSHHGRRILERYKSGYCMDEVPIKRSVMVENKKFTHDVFVREGFKHLRPATASYERKYEPGLASRIISDLGLAAASGDGAGRGQAVVLKLCNRSRGAGVCVVTAEELDAVLQKLLTPPANDGLEAWLRSRAPVALSYQFESQFEETCLHWWSNECPIFIAEEVCQSEPVAMESGGAERFDGTLRVAFALHRGTKTHKWEGQRSIKPFDIDWLGGYWKLPRVPSVREGSGEEAAEGLEDLHGRIVSSFNSREKRTAEVDESHLKEVYDALAPALPRIFQTGSLGVQQIQDTYANNTLFRTFALARAAAQLRAREMPKALTLYGRCREMVQNEVKTESGASDMPRCSAMSYVVRNTGVCHAMQGDWNSAAASFRDALRLMPTNATALYLLGYYQLEQGMHEASASSLLRCLALDPDFKLPYIALGSVRLLQEQFAQAAEAARACLVRHPDAPVASFTLGQAIYHLLWLREVDESAQLVEEATSALRTAKQREPKQWSTEDEAMLHFFSCEVSDRLALQRRPIHTWKNVGWRP